MDIMKTMDIAIKDLLRSFRNLFGVAMMLVTPLLLTGLIYFAFGNIGGGGFNLPAIHVVVANLDTPDPHSGLAAGKLLADHLASNELAAIMTVRSAPDEASAIAAVDGSEADTAVIIPSGFTAALMDGGEPAAVKLYHDPTITIGPGIVKMVVGEFVDGFSGATIAVQIASKQLGAAGLAVNEQVTGSITGKYVAWIQSSQGGDTSGPQLMAVRSPSGEVSEAQESNQAGMIPVVMACMMIFFVFFTGAAAASTIVWEDEEGTLARLFTTPTSQATILGGKFLGGMFTIVVQILVLIVASMLLFNISWGNPATLAIMVAALVIASSGFGVFLMSFIKKSRQTGPVQGLVISLTGMLGGLFTSPTPISGALDTISLSVPQGWALRGMKLTLAGASPLEVLVPALVLLAIGLVTFTIGTLLFRRRFA